MDRSFDRKQYGLKFWDREIARVDIIVCAILPVNDYAVNKILYTGSPVEFGPRYKQTIMLPSYVRFLASEGQEVLDAHRVPLAKLLSRGWTVVFIRAPQVYQDLRWWLNVMQLVTEYQKQMYNIGDLEISYEDKFTLKYVVSNVESMVKQLPHGCKVVGDYVFSVVVPQSLKMPIVPFDHVDIIMDKVQLALFLKRMGNSLQNTKQ